MINKLMASFLLLLLAACSGDQPKVPRLEGQWQCGNGITVTFREPRNYTVTRPAAGESAGVYKLTVGKNNYHRIEWNPGIKDAEAPLPPNFRYFEHGKQASLFFYTHAVDDSVRCERGP